MAALLAGLPDAARLVLVGDSDQLPSVGPGRVLADLLESGAVPICRLDVVFRQDEAGLIVRNAHRILRGETPLSSERPDGDFFLVPRDEPEEALRTVLHIVTERLPQRFGLDPREQVQVLVPMRRGACGAESLNVALRQAIVGTAETPETQAAGEAPAASAGRPRAGDRVIQVRNDYEREVWNGDVGLATGPGPEGRGLRVRFDAAREVDYAPEDVDDLEPAWAITVHKSQGSEYPAVVIPLLTQHYRMLQRNLLYTAVTRGKRVVVLVASRRALAVALRNAESERRFTGLAGRLAAAR
jgi:exodeoxyribonuclease V alpha subunit